MASLGSHTPKRAPAAGAREAIEFVCSSLSFFGIPYCSSEHFRLAKQDSPEVASVLLKLIGDLLTLQPTLSDGDQHSLEPVRQVDSVLGANLAAGDEQAITTVRESLVSLRYPRHSNLFCQSDSQPSSRELLLAAGFLIDEMNLLERFRDWQKQSVSVALPPYPFDIRYTPGVQRAANETIDGLRKNSESISSDMADVEELCHVILQLHGKWRFATKQAEDTDLERLAALQKLKGSLQQWTPKNAVPVSQYELFVLEREGLYKEHLEALRKRSQVFSSWQLEEIFWRWMSGILELVQKPANEMKTTVEASQDVLSPQLLNHPSEVPDLLRDFEASLGHLRTALHSGFLKEDDEWHELQDAYNESGSKDPFTTFLRVQWDNQKKQLTSDQQRELKARLKSLGQAFDETLPAPWTNGVPGVEDERSIALLQHLRVLQKQQEGTITRQANRAGAADEMKEELVEDRNRIEQYIQKVKIQYDDAVERFETVSRKLQADVASLSDPLLTNGVATVHRRPLFRRDRSASKSQTFASPDSHDPKT